MKTIGAPTAQKGQVSQDDPKTSEASRFSEEDLVVVVLVAVQDDHGHPEREGRTSVPRFTIT